MDVASVREEARIHREVYIAVLRGALHDWSSHGEFAAAIGRTREYLQYLLSADDLRTPGAETAERIVNALGLPPDPRRDLLEQMNLASERRLRFHRTARRLAAEAMPREMLERMRSEHWAASYASDPGEAQAHYHLLRDLAEAVLRQIDARRQPLDFVETCLLLHDVDGALARHGDALYHARLADVTMRSLDPADYRRGRERFDHLRVNVWYAEAVTLTTLGQVQPAGLRLAAAQAASERSPIAARFWAPHVYRHQLAAMSGMARYSLYKVDDLARQAKLACDKRDDPINPQASLLIDTSLARAYLRHGGARCLRNADRLLRPAVEAIDCVPLVGPLHRVIVLRTFARVCWERRFVDEWDHYLRQALAIAASAGLDDQIGKMRREYGNAPGDRASTDGPPSGRVGTE